MFWLQMLRFKGVIGEEKGFLSEEALILIMITWLQKNFLLKKAQSGISTDYPKRILKEKVPEGGLINLGFAYSLRG